MKLLGNRISRWRLTLGGLALAAIPWLLGGTGLGTASYSDAAPGRATDGARMDAGSRDDASSPSPRSSTKPSTTCPQDLASLELTRAAARVPGIRPGSLDAGQGGAMTPWRRQIRVTVGPARAILLGEATMPVERAAQAAPPPPEAPKASLLPASVPIVRSADLEQIAQHAGKRIGRGFELGSRGAHFAARAEFVAALQMVAGGLDDACGQAMHGRALAAGMRAMKEADDFVPTGSRLGADLQIAEIVDGHSTPVLKAAETGNLTASAALQCYLDFAQQQLARAVEHEPVGSTALHALAETYGILAREHPPVVRAADQKAIALHRAALLVQPDSCIRANDPLVLPTREQKSGVPPYRLRVDDVLEMAYRLTHEETSTPYKLSAGDVVRVESFTDKELGGELIVQPDGTMTLRLLGQVPAAGRSVARLTAELEEAYKRYYKVPAITVTPLKVGAKLEDLRAAVDGRFGRGGQNQIVRITPDGSISLPMLGSVHACGLTLGELQMEVNEHYRYRIEGVEVTAILARSAPRFVHVLGEVARSGRFELAGPTTVLQSLAMAGGCSAKANLKQIVVLRRQDGRPTTAILVDMRQNLRAKQPCPACDLRLCDRDIVIVPKGPIHRTDGLIKSAFPRGVRGLF